MPVLTISIASQGTYIVYMLNYLIFAAWKTVVLSIEKYYFALLFYYLQFQYFFSVIKHFCISEEFVEEHYSGAQYIKYGYIEAV